MDVSPEFPTKAQRGESEELIPSRRDLRDTRIAPSQRASCHGFADGNPRPTHVGKVERARLRVFQVPNQLAENPRLIRVGDSPVNPSAAACVSTSAHERWCNATLRVLRPSTVTG